MRIALPFFPANKKSMAKGDFYNLGHNILELYNVLIQTRLPQVKRNVMSSIANLVYELPDELPNGLRLRKLGS